jgi:hypothetical protein
MPLDGTALRADASIRPGRLLATDRHVNLQLAYLRCIPLRFRTGVRDSGHDRLQRSEEHRNGRRPIISGVARRGRQNSGHV